MYQFDNRIVLTLDAGGTNFVFSAIQGNREVVEPLRLPSNGSCLERCLDTLVEGFSTIKAQLDTNPVAISFAFPGPADYVNGVIGDLPNLSAFRGGVALGPFLSDTFGIPVFINNDGNLFAYGEALAGTLPWINGLLADLGIKRRYENLLGITFGTGFGAGVVTRSNQLLLGDNNCGGDVWVFRNKKYPQHIAEESVSIRAVKRIYAEHTGDTRDLTPLDIFEIAEGNLQGDAAAAKVAFAELGEVAGDAIGHAITIVDGIITIGGGLSKASKYIMPSLMAELNATISTMAGATFGRLQSRAYYLDNTEEVAQFLADASAQVRVPRSNRMVECCLSKRIGVVISKIGTSRAIALGAYAFALNQLDAGVR